MFSKTLCLLVLPFALALLAGAVLPFQAAGNAAVGRALGHWLWGAFTSLTVSSLVVIFALLILRVPAPDMGKALQGPWWLWVGGVLGALYVAGAAALTPRLGAAGFLVLVVAGQIITAGGAEHFWGVGVGGKPLSLARVGGGVVLPCGGLPGQGTWGAGSPAHA
ncbi:DMT family transporter, partial [Pseudomonas sp. KCJK8521]|uniref:DMT family transporter n=1 Tax=Pseudomonas sp. KCJK8521 TaxID=3344557 RepID=UPI0039060B15